MEILFSEFFQNIFISWFTISGGDDVQQLCEAGEEEFLEIMMLVDMASKPLHVRRLQKALQEWVQNPGKHAFIDSFNFVKNYRTIWYL